VSWWWPLEHLCKAIFGLHSRNKLPHNVNFYNPINWTPKKPILIISKGKALLWESEVLLYVLSSIILKLVNLNQSLDLREAQILSPLQENLTSLKSPLAQKYWFWISFLIETWLKLLYWDSTQVGRVCRFLCEVKSALLSLDHIHFLHNLL
jgi:hypothetical protein